MKRKTARLVLSIGLILIMAGGCAQEGVDYAQVEDIVDQFPFEAEPVEVNPQLAEESNLYAVFHTSAGEIKVMLYPDESPDEVSRFVEQVKAGEYDGQQFVYVRRDGIIETDRVAEDDAQSSSTSDSASVPQSESAAQPISESQPESASETVSTSKPESTSQSASASQSEGMSQASSEVQSESTAQPVSDSQSESTSQSASTAQSESTSEAASEPTQEELEAVELPTPPDDVEVPYYSDKLFHFYGSLGISRENETGGDRLHFVVETTIPEDERLVPATLYMNELTNLRIAELNAMTKEQPFTDLQIAAYEMRLNQEIQAIADDGLPEEYQQKYDPINKVYTEVGGQWALDYKYPVIGQIVNGQNIADAISQAKVDAQTRMPKQEIFIDYVEIVEE